MDDDDLESKIEQLESAAREAEVSGSGFREVWALVREIGADFKAVRFPTREQHQRAWDRYQAVVTELRGGAERRREEQAVQAAALDEALDDLERSVRQATSSNDGWRQVWTDIRALGQRFNGTRFPSKEARQER